MTRKTKILLIGACEGIGPELTIALRSVHGAASVITAGRFFHHCPNGRYRQLDTSDKRMLSDLVLKEAITQIYLLPDNSPAGAGQRPPADWDREVPPLLNVLKTAVTLSLDCVFWPGSTDVFGQGSPKHLCPQETTGRPDTAHGIIKLTCEYWCNHYSEQYGLDVRSIRLPGLISPAATPPGDLISYAAEMMQHALAEAAYTCFLEEDTCLPAIYLPDAVRAILSLMEVPASRLSVRTAYNVSAMSFSPCDLAAEIREHVPGFQISYAPDIRQAIANNRPASVNDQAAKRDWAWEPAFSLSAMVTDMLKQLGTDKPVRQQLPAAAFDDQYCFTRIDEA